MKKKFTTIITHEGKWYVATCIELGVVSQGRTSKSAEKNLKEAVELYLEDNPRVKFLGNYRPIIKTMEVVYV